MTPAPSGRLAENIILFARALRGAGLRVGPSQARTAVLAVRAAGFSSRDDFRSALRATLVNRAADLAVFEETFTLFWRDPGFLDRMLQMMLQQVQAPREERPKTPGQRRAEDAMAPPPRKAPPSRKRDEVELDMRLAWSGEERLRSMDFEQMSADELREAANAIRRLTLRPDPLPTRRMRRDRAGPVPDLRATLSRAIRMGGTPDRIIRKAPRRRPPDLVAICDISGSMTVYSRMLMRFLHALAYDPERRFGHVHGFTFSTRLTNVTRALRLPDPDAALAAVGTEAPDWQGGTRIGPALREFNRNWSRRVLGQGAIVLLITDGLERDDTAPLSFEAARLARSCRRLVWLNPLLRWQGFTPQAGGIRAILPHVSAFHACHSLDSLATLADAFRTDTRRTARAI